MLESTYSVNRSRTLVSKETGQQDHFRSEGHSGMGRGQGRHLRRVTLGLRTKCWAASWRAGEVSQVEGTARTNLPGRYWLRRNLESLGNSKEARGAGGSHGEEQRLKKSARPCRPCKPRGEGSTGLSSVFSEVLGGQDCPVPVPQRNLFHC